jgi:hypothetical protein
MAFLFAQELAVAVIKRFFDPLGRWVPENAPDGVDDIYSRAAKHLKGRFGLR